MSESDVLHILKFSCVSVWGCVCNKSVCHSLSRKYCLSKMCWKTLNVAKNNNLAGHFGAQTDIVLLSEWIYLTILLATLRKRDIIWISGTGKQRSKCKTKRGTGGGHSGISDSFIISCCTNRKPACSYNTCKYWAPIECKVHCVHPVVHLLHHSIALTSNSEYYYD